MLEKVYCVHDWWDMTILSGTADCKGVPYSFKCLFQKEADDWSDVYVLTPLTASIFSMEMDQWAYWLHWLRQSLVPHPTTYAQLRASDSFDDIVKEQMHWEEWEKAESYYQQQQQIDYYLNQTAPTLKATGKFSDSVNGTNTFVEWSSIWDL